MTSPDPRPAADSANTSASASLTRRRLLAGAAAGAGAGWIAALAACVNMGRRARTRPTVLAPAVAGPPDEMPFGMPVEPSPRVLSSAEWRTLEAALDVMLPSGPGSPGARDCNGIGYLDAALADPDTDPADAALVRAGAVWLDEEARSAARGAAFGGRPAGTPRTTDFASASADVRDAAMHAVGRRERGPDWMTLVLAFGLESMLGDPIHGGNPGEIGWHWIDHRPGDPRPTGTPVALPKAVEPGMGRAR